jgi:hypothetical protein
MPIDLASYERQLKSFGEKFEQFAGKKRLSPATTTAATTTVGDESLKRALEHSSRILSRCEKKFIQPTGSPKQYQSTSSSEAPFSSDAQFQLSVPPAPSSPARRSNSNFQPAYDSSPRQAHSRSPVKHSSVIWKAAASRRYVHPPATAHSKPEFEQALQIAEDLDGIDVQELQWQDFDAAIQMKHVQTKQNEELLKARTKELRDCRQENVTLRIVLDSARVDCQLLRDQLKQALSMNREMRQQLAEYEYSATQKALASVKVFDCWKKDDADLEVLPSGDETTLI